MTKGGVSSEFLDLLRSKCDIVDVASKYLTLNRRGNNYWACCPFHHEKTASFSIKQDAQFYKCFGCGESGNVITLVMKMENVDFITAVEILAKFAGMEMPSQADNEEMRIKKQQRDKAYAILNATTEFYHKNLLDNPNSLQVKYLNKRAISNEMIEKFKIGASLDYTSLPIYLSSLGFKPEDMISAGVVGKDEQGKLYDFYGMRLLFPIFNSFGDVVAYSGRSVDENPQHAKYKNTPQTIVFNKSEILFAYNFVRDLKKQHMLDTIIIVEGHIDVISCHQVGITNTIGCMGTAFTQLHAKKIKQLVDNVILCLDGDDAGAHATYKALDTLTEAGLKVKVVRLKNAKDPDEYIKKFGKDEFLNEIYNGMDCVDFVLHDTAKKYDLNTNADKNNYITEALNYISKFSTPAEQEIYLTEVQKLTHVPIDALRKSMKNETQLINIVEKEEIPLENVKDNNIRESKIMLLSAILYKKYDNFEEISGLFETDDELSELYKYLKERKQNNKEYNASSLFDDFSISSNSLIDKVVNYVFPSDEVFSTYLKETLSCVKIYELEKKREEIKSKMLNSASLDEQYDYLKQLKDIANKIDKEKKC